MYMVLRLGRAAYQALRAGAVISGMVMLAAAPASGALRDSSSPEVNTGGTAVAAERVWRTLGACVGGLLISGAHAAQREYLVGSDVLKERIREFYYTLSSSAYPPRYQRFRFFMEDGRYLFYHESRAGNHFPLREKDVTASGTRELRATEWDELYSCLENGTVRARREHLESGGAGPWLYLYWDGDAGRVQEYTFASHEKRKRFEAWCEALAKSREDVPEGVP